MFSESPAGTGECERGNGNAASHPRDGFYDEPSE
jgi:hypothetical protein